MKKKRSGFTLVEIMVVVSSVGVIMMIVAGTILQTMKAQNRSEGLSRLFDEGNRILSELRRNVFNSTDKIVCSSDNLSIGLTNLTDGIGTSLICNSISTVNSIASASGAKVKNLNATDINIVNCNQFVVCTLDPGTTKISAVTFNFGIGTTVSGVGVTQNFSTTLSTRN